MAKHLPETQREQIEALKKAAVNLEKIAAGFDRERNVGGGGVVGILERAGQNPFGVNVPNPNAAADPPRQAGDK